MTNFNIEIKNLKKFKKALAQSPELAKKTLKNSLEESVYEWQRQSGMVTPVDTGRLRRGVVNPSSIRVDKARAILSPNIEYAIYVHEGTSRMKKRPFFKWGLDRAKRKIQKIFEANIDKLFKNIADKTNF